MAALSPNEVPALGVQALQRWRTKNPNARRISMHGNLGLHMAALLGEGASEEIDTGACKEPFLYDQTHDYMLPFAEFVWWLVRMGVRTPSLSSQNDAPTALFLRTVGQAFLDAADDHPSSTGFLQRLACRCPNLPDEVIAHPEDAHACLQRGLRRPAIVLLGLAYETAIERIGQYLVRGELIRSHLRQHDEDRPRTIRMLVGNVGTWDG